jgi:hypothetical protein
MISIAVDVSDLLLAEFCGNNYPSGGLSYAQKTHWASSLINMDRIRSL